MNTSITKNAEIEVQIKSAVFVTYLSLMPWSESITSESESRKIVEELGTKQDQEELEVILKQPTRDKVKEASIVKKTIEKSLEKAVTSKSLEKIETEETSVINAVKKISPVIDSKNITGYVNKERGIRAEEEILNTHEIKHDKKISSRKRTFI